MKKSIYTTEYKKLISKIKSARKDAKLSQLEVAKRINRTQSYISKIESGEIRIDIVQLKELSIVYRKSIEYFL